MHFNAKEQKNREKNSKKSICVVIHNNSRYLVANDFTKVTLPFYRSVSRKVFAV